MAAATTAPFWQKARDKVRSGALWRDGDPVHSGEPATRLKEAIDGLPKVGAFQDAAVAAREMVRQRMKNGEKPLVELGLLYWLAALNSYPDSDSERQEALAGDRLYDYDFDYARLGYERLELLNKTDRGWLVDHLGEPEAHVTLKDLYRVSGRSAPPERAEAEPQAHASDALRSAGDAAHHARAAVVGAAEDVKAGAEDLRDKASDMREKTETRSTRWQRRTDHGLQKLEHRADRAGTWLGRRIGTGGTVADPDESRFLHRADTAVVGLGGLAAVLLIVAILF
ncbi:MAG: hypothetical protein GVY28_05075 [Alphaproteobacteria bacterium]|jgi:hypothetical protein|nr:hypothetical protein [Alphaproteobacteria bacterium]